MLVTCNSCNQPKIRISVGKYKYADSEGNRWRGKICPDCHRKSRGREKAEKVINCADCGITLNRKVVAQVRCPNCQSIRNKKSSLLAAKRHQKNNYTPSNGIKTTCLTCKTEFKRVNNKKYCSSTCKPKPKKAKYKPVEYSEKPCARCGTLFKPKRASAKYCKTTCTPSYRNQKVYRRAIRRCKHQKISSFYKKELLSIYNSRPDDHHVDHIVPLKHPDVCGLHVPWNLQYLPEDDNIKKSNKF